MGIYDQHDKAFSRVSAFVVAHEGKRVATIAFKFPADGAGRLYAYVHWLGEPMVRGFAGGFGYDKRSAACADAARKLKREDLARIAPLTHGASESELALWRAFRDTLIKDGGYHWDRNLETAGFAVWQAV
ncbi:hypothetical protein [Thauera sp.]|uniref:hypothetical protein n=1 Tax=Thauera sp. TaxID=1905334 RepID=UPI002C4D25D4|nr:hypothetical protein [Thauera sp.]HRP25357.1 hypothetical protein [Thauera sp.]